MARVDAALKAQYTQRRSSQNLRTISVFEELYESREDRLISRFPVSICAAFWAKRFTLFSMQRPKSSWSVEVGWNLSVAVSYLNQWAWALSWRKWRIVEWRIIEISRGVTKILKFMSCRKKKRKQFIIVDDFIQKR